MLRKLLLPLVALTISLLALAPVRADDAKPFLHPLFSDGAVLQRDVKVPVWGWAEPGEKITVEFAGQKQTATAGADGKWMAKLEPMNASAEPRELVVTGSAANHKSQITNILVGDVWICSGQSNMEMGIGGCNAPGEIASANFPLVRLLTVQKAVKYEPIETTACKWEPCSPQTVAANGWGGFSAAGFFFGRELHKALNIPIGLIHSSWGGTICEAWASAEGLAPLADFKDRVEQVQKTAAANREGKSGPDAMQEWYAKNDPGTRDGWAKPDADDSSWKPADVSKPWEQNGLPEFDGIGWYRKSFEAPADWAGKDLTLSLGAIDDMDTTFVNGVKVGGKDVFNTERLYKIPGALVKAGRNVIAIRVLDNQGQGGIYGNTALLHVGLAGNPQSNLALVDGWKLKDSAPLAKLNGRPAGITDNNPNVSTVLFNGMIAPLVPFAIKGAIWYQGESNGNRGMQYRSLLPAMIADWRAHFGVGDFPFYIVSLANFQQTAAEPGENDWANLREAQAMTAKNFKNCGLAITIDIGDAADIHPKNKMEVGRRLALAALAQTYGHPIEFSGPWYREMKVEDGKIRLSFDHAAGLLAKGDKLTGFAIAGEDKKFVWADATIDGKTVIVSSDKIPQPVAVRYAWAGNPVCNLYNTDNLPAVPFRTDTWPSPTDNNK